MLNFLKSLSVALLLVTTIVFVGEAQGLIPKPADNLEPKTKSGALLRSTAWTFGPAAVGTGLILIGAEGQGASDITVAVGIGIGVMGLSFGPGAGVAYSGHEQPYKGSWIRFLGCTVAGFGVAAIGFADAFNNDDHDGVFAFYIGIGGSIWLWSTIHDTVKANKEVDRYNREHGFTAVDLTPAYFPASNAGGLQLTLHF